MLDLAPASSKERPPRLSPIRAFFVPPDTSKTGEDQCGQTPSVGMNPSYQRCSTYYTTDLPAAVHDEDLDAKWRVLGEPKCGKLLGAGYSFPGYGDNPNVDGYADTYWYHSHPDQGGDCNDPYPHAGRVIAVRVLSKRWACRATYRFAASGTMWPDTSGEVGGDPKPCTPRSRG